MANDLVVEIDRISKRFAGHVAVSDLSLSVPRGSIYGLLGPNGAGKTTSIRMIMNITMPDEGTVKLFGDTKDGRHQSARIGYLPEERGLYKKMKVREMLVFLAETKGVLPAVAKRKADEWSDRLGLADWKNRKVEELSKGMSQKVQFIGTMLHEPELLILDEPFSGLDPINQQVLKDTIVQLARSGTTIIFSTHQMEVAERICDRVCIIARGKKVLDGELTSIKSNHGNSSIMLGFRERQDGARALASLRDMVSHVDDSGLSAELTMHPNMDAQEILRRMMAQNVPMTRFEIMQPSLHRIFLELAGPDASVPSRRAGDNV